MPPKNKKVLNQFSLAEIQSYLAAKKEKAKAERAQLTKKHRRLQDELKEVEKQLAALTPIRHPRKKRKKRIAKSHKPVKQPRKKLQRIVAEQAPAKQNQTKKPAGDSHPVTPNP